MRWRLYAFFLSLLAVAPLSAEDPVAESNKRTLERFFKAIEGEAPRDIRNFFANNYQIVNLNQLSDARGNKYSESNPDVDDRIAQLRHAFPHFQLQIVQMVAEGDQVFVEVELIAEQKGRFLGIEPTGKELMMRSFAVYTLSEGKIRKVVELTNLLSLMRQLGYVILAD